MGQRILALELSGNKVRAAVAERTYKTLDLTGVYEQARGEGEPDLSDAIGRIVKVAGQPDVVVSSIPGEFVAKRLLALPFTDRRRLEQVVAYALEEHLPFAVDNAAVAFARVGRQLENTLVIAAATRREIVRQHLELLTRVGLDPKTITLSTLALAEMVTRVGNGNSAAHLVVDIDSACTSLVLVDATGTPRAMRTLSHGIDFRVNGGMPAPASNAIFAAARQTMLAHGDLQHPELVLAGSAAEAAGMREHVARALQASVRDVGDFDYSPLIHTDRATPKRFAGCIAMLLAEAPSKPLELINFRQGEFAFSGSSGAASRFRLPLLLAGMAVAAAVLQFALGIAVSVRQLHILNRQIAAITAPALGQADPATAKTALQARIAEMSKKLRLMGVNVGHGSPLEVLLAVSRAIPAGLPVQINTLQIDENGMKLEGEADSFSSVDQVKRALQRNREFGQIEVDHAAAGADASKVDFHLTATLSD
jgi:hypothetical protein